MTINGKKTQLVCVPDARFEVRNYLKKFLTYKVDQIPLTIIIKEFSLKELPDNQLECTFSFDYTINTSQLRNKIITLKHTVPFNQTAKDIEQAIKGTMQKTLTTIQSEPLEIKQPQVEETPEYTLDPVTDMAITFVEGGYFANGILFKASHTSLRINELTGVGMGLTVGSQIPVEVFSYKNISWTEGNLMAGLELYKRINRNWYGNLALHLPLGLVFMEDKISFVIGLTAHQRIMLLRVKGLKFSLGAFESISTHPFMPLAAGVTLGIGYNYKELGKRKSRKNKEVE